jgi:hypothetical protein
MSNCLSDFVDQLEAAGPLAAPASLNNGADALFSSLINNELQLRVGPDGLLLARQAVSDYFKAVQLCRENNPAGAQVQLHHCDALLASLPSAATDFVRLFRIGAWSNYYYKTRQSELAISLLREGFGISAALERQGYPAFLYWRIGQLLNISTVLFKEQAHENGHQLLKNALVFTHSGEATGLLTDDWHGVAITTVRTLQESALDQLFGQLARQNILLLHHETYDSAYYCRFFFAQLLAEMETETYNRMVLYNWLHAKVSYQEEGLLDFLTNTLNFITDPAITRDYDVFKVNLLAQARLYTLQQAPGSKVLADRIKHFSDAHFSDRLGKVISLA